MGVFSPYIAVFGVEMGQIRSRLLPKMIICCVTEHFSSFCHYPESFLCLFSEFFTAHYDIFGQGNRWEKQNKPRIILLNAHMIFLNYKKTGVAESEGLISRRESSDEKIKNEEQVKSLRKDIKNAVSQILEQKLV